MKTIKKQWLPNIIAIFVLLLATCCNVHAQEKCIRISVEIDNKKYALDNSLKVLIVKGKDTLTCMISKNCISVPEMEFNSEVDLIIKLKDVSLFYPQLPVNFLKIQSRADWLAGTTRRPFNKRKYSFLRNSGHAYRIDYLVVRADSSETVWYKFKRRKDGSYILPK